MRIESLEPRFRTLSGYAKLISGAGWIVVVLGVVQVIVGLGYIQTLGPVFLVSGIPVAVIGLVIVASGQVITCFVAIEENTRATSTLLRGREDIAPRLGPAMEERQTSGPAIPEGYKFSADQAAQAISVTRGTLQGYISSGRIHANADGTIDAEELSRAGFIIRNFPPRSA